METARRNAAGILAAANAKRRRYDGDEEVEIVDVDNYDFPSVPKHKLKSSTNKESQISLLEGRLAVLNMTN